MSNSQFHEIVVGYDARIVWSEQRLSCGDIYSTGDFRYYLMVDEPYSTDYMVWPSVFDKGSLIKYGVDLFGQWLQDRLPLPEWTGPVNGTWEHLSAMRLYLQENSAAIKRSYWVIAVSVFYEKERPDDCYFSRNSIQADPPVQDARWQMLGYDVSDYSLNSALNAYWPQEPDKRSRWKHLLNEHHLFADIDDAREFRDFVDQNYGFRDEQYTYGIYRVIDV